MKWRLYVRLYLWAGVMVMQGIIVYGQVHYTRVTREYTQRLDEVKKKEAQISTVQEELARTCNLPAPSGLRCSVVHQDHGKCPDGYQREDTPRFAESDGTKEFACVATTKTSRPCIDVLKPGEGFSIVIEIPRPPPPPPPSLGQKRGT